MGPWTTDRGRQPPDLTPAVPRASPSFAAVTLRQLRRATHGSTDTNTRRAQGYGCDRPAPCGALARARPALAAVGDRVARVQCSAPCRRRFCCRVLYTVSKGLRCHGGLSAFTTVSSAPGPDHRQIGAFGSGLGGFGGRLVAARWFWLRFSYAVQRRPDAWLYGGRGGGGFHAGSMLTGKISEGENFATLGDPRAYTASHTVHRQKPRFRKGGNFRHLP